MEDLLPELYSFIWIMEMLFSTCGHMEGRICSFSSKGFRYLGNHRKSYSERRGRLYEDYMAIEKGKKVRSKPDSLETQVCTVRGKGFSTFGCTPSFEYGIQGLLEFFRLINRYLIIVLSFTRTVRMSDNVTSLKALNSNDFVCYHL